MRTISILVIASILMFGQSCNQHSQSKNLDTMEKNEQTDHYSFPLSEKVTRQKVTFKNRYGITLTGDLYLPKNRESKPVR